MMDPTPFAEGLAKNPLAWGLALALIVIGYLFRLVIAQHEKHVETIKAAAKDQREILAQVIPLSVKLMTAIELLERITDKITRGEA